MSGFDVVDELSEARVAGFVDELENIKTADIISNLRAGLSSGLRSVKSKIRGPRHIPTPTKFRSGGNLWGRLRGVKSKAVTGDLGSASRLGNMSGGSKLRPSSFQRTREATAKWGRAGKGRYGAMPFKDQMPIPNKIRSVRQARGRAKLVARRAAANR